MEEEKRKINDRDGVDCEHFDATLAIPFDCRTVRCDSRLRICLEFGV